MVAGAGEPMAKRAKADEEEARLVRRREELVRLLGRARKAKDSARAKKELVTLCADLEAKNRKLLEKLPPELWQKIVDQYLHQNDLLALAMTCRFFREKQKDLGKKMETNVWSYHLLELQDSGKRASHSLGWFRWVCDTFEILPGLGEPSFTFRRVKGAVYEGDLVQYAALQGSVEILRWLMEEKGWELNEHTGKWVGLGGAVEVLASFLRGKGYEFDEEVCAGAARGGHLEALKWLRAQDPRCPWDERTCWGAAAGGYLDILKWARAQDPPCPWSVETCAAAAYGGHLDVLKWLRSQDPPCPWMGTTCYEAAEKGHLDVLKWARSQDPPCPWDEETCEGAAIGGHLDVLKWLRSQDPPCPWDENVCYEAARKGHLEILKWAFSQNPPCEDDYYYGCANAAGGGHLEVLKFLRGLDPPCPWSRSDCRAEAECFDHQHIVNWIDQHEDESDVEY